ncbi:dehydrogenase [Neoasaia chiangmaiensis NBRC 101099]|uniref:Oxidoreductase n=1 Tax=Neoasaia chiangmaiensis TaxID=320497 RepID=A0A1U9KN02_9PROT|nr:glucose 1-dehydrogenase [Neoasaia chiangmaiensis]AQS87165.1 oxidoreductase [Neoasaia chiangmaiensis]GBR38208.1 dehydrogenase [Neoasaia chiangmaiensis NBRC 101099]GEN15990.1 oxidoreductase [Neoasaia chiangmaiensis]
MGKLTGKVALVTGASKGIGAQIAKALASEGASVVVNYASSREGAEKVVSEIAAAGGKAVAAGGNVAVEADVAALFAAGKEAFGTIDIVVNNAGVYAMAPLEDVTPESFHRHFDINVLGLLLVSRAAAAQFGPQGGNIINIGSVASRLNMAGNVVYTATKYAVDGITRVLAKELGGRNIRVNSINPGLVATEGVEALGVLESDMVETFKRQTPLGRVGKPDDIAKVAVFLASDDSYWVTGETIAASGGM